MGTVLVTGGSGYVGSHTVKLLHKAGRPVVVFDDLVEGHREAVSEGVPLVEGSLHDGEKLRATIDEHDVESVIHFAARCYVGESVSEPRKYFRDNVAGSLSLMEALVDRGVRNLVFSSSCAVYGIPDEVPIVEETPRAPINPYGWSKFAVEDMLKAFDAAYDFRYIALRYFNAAGADPEGELGEWHDPETHIIPLALRAALDSDRVLKVFGDDYPTPDGTCIRDYIHVTDLGAAHLLALDRLRNDSNSMVLNLGTGRGFSVRQVIDAANAVSERAIAVEVTPRRPGDPPELVADNSRASRELGWKPSYDDLETIVRHAWTWLKKHPNGY